MAAVKFGGKFGGEFIIRLLSRSRSMVGVLQANIFNISFPYAYFIISPVF